MKIRNCELCSESAAVYCPSDAAYLCRSCDSKVHNANFLVARHVRQSLSGISGAGFHTFPANSDSDSDCESACVSSTTSPPAKEYSGGKRDSRGSSSEVSSRPMSVNYCKVEGVLVNWSVKLGLGESGDVAVRTALRTCLDNRTRVLPFRVLLAASMWLGLKLKTWRVLKRLEEVSGVPAKIILAAESKLAREMRDERRQNRRRLELEEGWAEC